MDIRGCEELEYSSKIALEQIIRENWIREKQLEKVVYNVS